MDHNISLKRNEMDYRANEAFKTLRTNIQFCGNDIKVISLTSCTPNEGKSSVSFNLAVSLTEIGKRVIMIDADLRKSVLIGRYRVGEIESGLTHYLSGQMDMENIIYHTQTNNFDIIFSGSQSPNPAELLSHVRFSTLLNKLREEYDYVIVDTPPLGSVIDGAIVAKNMDAAILVIEVNAISYRFAQNVKEQLDKANCRILGAVLNKIPMDKNGYYGKYYGKYYSKYYGTYGG